MSGADDRWGTEMPVREKEMPGLDAWLKQELADRYGSALDEPIPSDLLALLNYP